MADHTLVDRLNGCIARRHGGIIILLGVFLFLSLLTRLALLAGAAQDVSWDSSLCAVFAWGCLFDVATASWLALPMILMLSALPTRFFRMRWARVGANLLAFILLGALLFSSVAEWFFWGEFGVRFNFIAVDYLIYTTEVIGNIRESYPMPAILSGLLAASALLFWLVWKTGLPARWLAGEHESFSGRWLAGSAWSLGALAIGLSVHSTWLPSFANNFNRELAQNGIGSLFAAFRNNNLDYNHFYATVPVEEAFRRLRHELSEDGSALLRPEKLDTLRYVRGAGVEQHPNIIQITVESLSASFVGAWNPESRLTPNLDALARLSLVFTRFYATGTRTDRGMEALVLSIPPTPGRSIVKRPHNENLFTLGSILRAKDYDTAFIYGGFGYFDNMNYFFGNNGYRVVDRNTVSHDDISFANIWGACDEDLYDWTLREADAAAATGRPFHFFVMTTSNHRPYTFPEGRIDMPSRSSGRAGAVKYTDFAIGRFLNAAASKPWFRDTVFVIVADHCASSAGRTELPVANYHIPLLIYAPGGQVAPGRNDTLMSQMDFAPTLLGLLNWTYLSRFFGHDVRRIDPSDGHALIGTYQKIGHLEKDELVVLSPQQVIATYPPRGAGQPWRADDPQSDGENEAISFYQTASYVFHNGIYRELNPDEIRLGLAEGERIATGNGKPSVQMQ